MPGLVVPKPWPQPHPPKPNEELWLKGLFRCALAIYNPARQGQGKTRGWKEMGGVGWGCASAESWWQFSDQRLLALGSPKGLPPIPRSVFQLWKQDGASLQRGQLLCC